MPRVQRFAEFLTDLQQLERSTLTSQGSGILDVFTRHTPFDEGALYFRDPRETSMRLVARSGACVAPEMFDAPWRELVVDPRAHVLLPLRTNREELGVLALSQKGKESSDEEDLAMARIAAEFLSTLITNQRLMQETREGEFQLKYRLWELESLYDIGLSIASTLNIDELADEILFRMISLTNARRASLYLREGDRFVLYRSFGDVRSEILDQDLASRLVAVGAPLSFTDNADSVFPGCSAYVAVPIKGNNNIIGVLAAADRENRDGTIGAFQENELRLLTLFASQAAIALENARLHKSALEKQVMERELELAATIQRDILPKSIPVVENIEIAALSRPARQVGGDYHAFFQRDGVLSMVLADVAGKSMPAALLVSAFHAAIQLLFAEGRELGDIATELNRHLHSWSAENKFVTMVMASIDLENETLEFINAGHNPCYVVVDGKIDTLKSHGLPIGILSQSRYLTQKRSFPAGSVVLLYSDGITEAENAAGDEYGNDRLEELLAAHPDASPLELRDLLAKAVVTFVAEAPQKDDETLVIARRA